MRLERIGFVFTGLALACACASACAGSAPTPEHPESEEVSSASFMAPTGPVEIPLPRKSTALRDDRAQPVLQVASTNNVVYPTVYGYPIYPEGDAAQGLFMFRRDNWAGVKRRSSTDESGVVHETEHYAQLGCRIEGVRENASKFVPRSLTCELPPPRGVGGSKRPVVGELTSGAKAEQLLQDQSIEEVFLGSFHLTSRDFASGSGEGFFNTTHGQLAFGFSRKKLTHFVYYFDPTVAGWQNPTLWVKP